MTGIKQGQEARARVEAAWEAIKREFGGYMQDGHNGHYAELTEMDEAVEALATTPPKQGEDAVREAAQGILDRMFSTYKTRNGREVGIEGDDGEKCWIVHSDDIEQLRAALSANQSGDDAGEEDEPKPWKGRTVSEQATYDHFMGGSERGDLYVYVKRGRLGVMQPERSSGHAYAAWMAGKHLAARTALSDSVGGQEA